MACVSMKQTDSTYQLYLNFISINYTYTTVALYMFHGPGTNLGQEAASIGIIKDGIYCMAVKAEGRILQVRHCLNMHVSIYNLETIKF